MALHSETWHIKSGYKPINKPHVVFHRIYGKPGAIKIATESKSMAVHSTHKLNNWATENIFSRK